ncbi:hypothetical protein H4I96_04776 [Botrytis cinerea]
MAGRVQSFLDSLGPEVEDPEEEAFLLFSQTIPSQNLGFVDSKATEIDLTINGRDLTIYQSPTILSSNRDGGTTGAGKSTLPPLDMENHPLFAKWISSPTNPLLQHQIITSDSIVLELGCGISGLIALTLSPLLQTYILTDQPYVLKFLSQNLSSNSSSSSTTTSKSKSRKSKAPSSTSTSTQQTSTNKIIPLTLDWETDVVSPSLTCSETTTSFDTIIACDCIYNDALIPPFVQTCVDLCRLRSASSPSKNQDQTEPSNPTLCVIAQQLRSPDVFESWLKEFNKFFKVWRVQEGDIQECGLGEDSGFVVHVGILR